MTLPTALTSEDVVVENRLTNLVDPRTEVEMNDFEKPDNPHEIVDKANAVAMETLLDETAEVCFREEITEVAEEVMETVASVLNNMIVSGKLCNESIDKLLREEYGIMLTRILTENNINKEEKKIIEKGVDKSKMAHRKIMDEFCQEAIVRRIRRSGLTQL